MTELTPKNVFSLGADGKRRKGPPVSATELMRECQRLASGRLGRLVSTTLDKVDDALFTRARKAASTHQQTRWLNAMREVRQKRARAEERFQKTFSEGFTNGIPRTGKDNPPTNPPGGNLNPGRGSDDDLTLVNHEQLQESLAISNMASKLHQHCNTLLFALDQRIGTLIDDPELERWQNPVGPDAICNALQAACQVIEGDSEARLIMLGLFDQLVLNEIRGLYQALNACLLDSGLLPEIRSKAHQPTATTDSPGTPTAPETGADTPATHEAAIPENQPQEKPHQHTITGAAAIKTLTLLQHGDANLLNTHLAGTDGAGQNPQDVTSGTANILTRLGQAGILQDLGKSADMTLNIVAGLFDYILDDSSIHDAIRALIGRLQIPILKVALLDHDLLVNKSHPARRLLNNLASIALGWSDQHGTQDPVYRKANGIVQRILDEFEADTELFETLNRDLEVLVNEESERAGIRAERSIKVAEGRERIEVAKITALNEIQQSDASACTSQLVRNFVSGHWKNLLFIICAQHGKGSEEWKSVVQTMRDLIWSVTPKCSIEDRKRLAGMQNHLLQRLRMGMAQLSIPDEEQQQFLTGLVRIHGRTATATAMDESACSPQDVTAVKTTGFTGKAVEAVLASRQISLAEVNRKPVSRPGTTRVPQDEYDRLVAQLQEGQWLELTGMHGNRLRAKLSWISPVTGTYLFTDRQGLKTADMKHEEIAAELRSQRARVLDATPLFDRAVSTVLKQYASQDEPAS